MKKNKNVKKTKCKMIIQFVAILLLFLGLVFFIVINVTSIGYKLKTHGYSNVEMTSLKKLFNQEELLAILKYDYHKDYFYIIESKQFQKSAYLKYFKELEKGKAKEDILNEFDPMVNELRKKEGYKEENLSLYVDYIYNDNDSDKDIVIEYVNFLKELKEKEEYHEQYTEEYLEYYFEDTNKSVDNVINFINFKHSIQKNSLYQEKYLNNYLDYYLKNSDKNEDYVLKYVNFINDVVNGKNYNKSYYYRYIDNYLKDMNSNIDDVIAKTNAEERKKEEQILAPSNEKMIDVTEVDGEKFKTAKYYIADYQERYVNYQARNPSKSVNEVIQAVNSNIDYRFYTNMKSTNTSEGYLMLVNKFYTVGSGFVPQLKSVSGGGYLEPTAADAFEKMVGAAWNEAGLDIWNVSGYRSYGTQNSLYTNYKARDGQEKADTYSARPGSSEHQTGLATDICTASSSEHFENNPRYFWLLDNSYKYGFILRYPEGKTYITGYKFEPWHFRYVGLEAAKYIHDNNITFEEYHAYFVSH